MKISISSYASSINHPTPQQIAAWAEAIRASDRKAYAALYDAFYEPLLRYAWTLTRDKETSYDILHDVFERLWTMRARLDPNRSVKALLFRMVRNDSFKSKRRKKFEQTLLDGPAPPYLEAATDQVLDAAFLEVSINAWIEEMPVRRREVFELSRISGMSHQEISSVLGLSIKTVNNHLVNALRYLRKRLEEYGIDPRHL